MLTLYHAPRSRSFRTLWLLEEIGAPYELKVVAIRRGDGTGSEQPEYRQIHPHAKVPAIVHDGALVFETPAVALYLTDLFPDAGLGPRIGDKLRGPYLTWLTYSTGVLEPAITMRTMKAPHKPGQFGWGPAEEVEATLKHALQKGPYLLGEKFSAADIVVGGTLAFMMQFKLFTETPLFAEYAKRIMSRPAVGRAQAKDNG